MPSPAQLLLTRAVEVLGTIRTDDGYQTDAGAEVTTEPARLFDEDAPAEFICVYLDLVERPNEPAVRNTGWMANLVVIGRRRADADERQGAQIALLEDIERAMAVRAGWPVGVQAPVFQQAKFINRAEGTTWVGVAVGYSAHITRPRA